MKLQASKARLWLVTLTITAATVAAAQTLPAPASFTSRGFQGSRDAAPVLSANNSAEAASTFTTTVGPSLPDAPSAVAASRSPQDQTPSVASAEGTQKPPMPPTNASLSFMFPTFLAANGALLGSTIANVEMISRCQPSACQSVPDAIRHRGTLYGIGIPSSVAVSYLSYRLKRGGTRWWIVPVAVFTAGNIVYAVHASQWSR